MSRERNDSAKLCNLQQEYVPRCMKGDSSSPPSRKVLGPGNCISWWRDQGHGGRRLRQGGLGPPCRRWDGVGQGPGTCPPRGWSTQATRPGSGDLHSALTRSLESSWHVTFFACCVQRFVRRRPVLLSLRPCRTPSSSTRDTAWSFAPISFWFGTRSP